jgi:hypothetical protein
MKKGDQFEDLGMYKRVLLKLVLKSTAEGRVLKSFASGWGEVGS